MSFTILGASGFIGSHLARWMAKQGIPYHAPHRDECLTGQPLGNIVYCVGLTADFRTRPYDTVRAHVCHLADILEHAVFDSLLYLSTTRLYAHAIDTRENATIPVLPADSNDLYNISKAMGESLCLSVNRSTIRVARLSNVYGSDFTSANFLASVVRDAVTQGRVVLRTSLASSKDYVSIEDVISLLPRIAAGGRRRLYNVASGVNTTNEVLMAAIRQETGCTVEVVQGAETTAYQPILIDAIRDEFAVTPAQLLQSLPELIAAYRREMASP